MYNKKYNNNKFYERKPLTKEEQFEKMLKKALKQGNDKQKDKNKREDKKIKDHSYKLPYKNKEKKVVEEDE